MKTEFLRAENDLGPSINMRGADDEVQNHPQGPRDMPALAMWFPSLEATRIWGRRKPTSQSVCAGPHSLLPSQDTGYFLC